MSEGGHDHVAQRLRQSGTLAVLRSRRSSLESRGVRGWELFEEMATAGVRHREAHAARTGRCGRCWHEGVRCVCGRLPSLRGEVLPGGVRLLILMHHKEYLSAGNSAKLLLRMMPDHQVELFVFGLCGEMDRLARELAVDPTRNLTLWPGENSVRLDEYLGDGPERGYFGSSPTLKLKQGQCLRVVALDGTYSNAKHMRKALRKRLGEVTPQEVALHPATTSVFRRAQKNYGESANKGASSCDGSTRLARRVSTAEACGLLLIELGASAEVWSNIVRAVLLNNEALS